MKEGTKVKVKICASDVFGSEPSEGFWIALDEKPDAVFTVIHTGYK